MLRTMGRSMALAGLLAVVGGLGLGASSARAQGIAVGYASPGLSVGYAQGAVGYGYPVGYGYRGVYPPVYRPYYPYRYRRPLVYGAVAPVGVVGYPVRPVVPVVPMGPAAVYPW